MHNVILSEPMSIEPSRVHMADLLESLYEFNSLMVRVYAEESEALSPKLFNIYGEHIILKTPEHWAAGISIGGRKISNPWYAEDTTLIVPNEKEMTELVNLVKIASEKLALHINA